jgi:oligopeptide/dipeptide ABC transporter ATP-binding protein
LNLLEVEDLRVAVRASRDRTVTVIDTANLTVEGDEAVGVLGESGSGKTMLCRSIMGTLGRRGAIVTGGRIKLAGRDVANAPESTWRAIRGRQIGYVPQSSLAGLNPVLTVETQMIEAVTAVRPLERRAAEQEALRLLELVRIPRASTVFKQRAVQLSGGMRQRVMIATALSQQPRLLVADEPTTALDVRVEHEILTLITSLRRELGMALILVSHDLSVIEEVCDTVMVMYAGATVEAGPVERVVSRPRHPYSRALGLSRVDTAAPERDLEVIPGDPPTVGRWPAGCRFWPRCPLADQACQTGAQPGLVRSGSQLTACIHTERMAEP